MVNLGLIASGIVLLGWLRWYRAGHRDWIRSRSETQVVGYLLPLLGIALVLLGIGHLWTPAEIGSNLPNDGLLLVFLLGVLVLLTGLLSILGVPMPRVLLPRWARPGGKAWPRTSTEARRRR